MAAKHSADITAGDARDNERLFRLILQSGLPFDQLIDEKGYAWLHVSYSTFRHFAAPTGGRTAGRVGVYPTRPAKFAEQIGCDGN